MTEAPAAGEVVDELPPDDDTAGMLDLNLVRRYKRIKDALDASTAEVDALKQEAAALEAQLVDAFADAGMQNVNIDGKTVYLHRAVYARWSAGLDMEAKKAALRNAGAEDLVTETVNAQTLNAWVRELTEDDDAPGLPSELTGILEPGERFSIRVNAAGSRKKSKTHSK